MSDTQWPRYEVFEQERPNRPFQNVGSVHAPDPELALLNARDVFVRRPDCAGLWVVPASAIFAKTAEELEADNTWKQTPVPADAPLETWLVFQKKTQRNVMTYVTHVGEVEARSPAEALAKALEAYATENVYVWWVVPERMITRSSPEDAGPWFTPARYKTYKLPTEYKTVTQIRQAKAQKRKSKQR
ncbi:MAG: phenylacetic acid degradation protein [Chloroflexi bacterium]|nr:MAG: phenylacetic acid degradation protein [Chloroflexota bacterium]